MIFDPTKPVQTRDGRKARIICTDRNNKDFPIIACVTRETGEEIYAYTNTGTINTSLPSGTDLVNVPETRRVHIVELNDKSRWYRDSAPSNKAHGGTYLGYLEYTDDQLKK